LLSPIGTSSFSGPSHTEETDDWKNLMIHSVGFMKSVFVYSVTTVYLELISLLEEQEPGQMLTLPGHPAPPTKHRENQDTLYPQTNSSSVSSYSESATLHTPSRAPLTLPSQFHLLRNILQGAKDIAELRLRAGETNAKVHVFLSCTLARVDALAAGRDTDAVVVTSAKESVETSREIFRVHVRSSSLPEREKEEVLKGLYGIEERNAAAAVRAAGVDGNTIADMRPATGGSATLLSAELDSALDPLAFSADVDWDVLTKDADFDDVHFGDDAWIFGSAQLRY
jgi:hypothetical protein